MPKRASTPLLGVALALLATCLRAQTPTQPTLAKTACAPAGTHTLCEVIALSEACGPKSPFGTAVKDLVTLDRKDPRILLNLAKAGLDVRYDSALVAASPGAGALYLPTSKSLVLMDDGGSAVFELAHAIDDALQPDNWSSAKRAQAIELLAALSERRQGDLLAGIDLTNNALAAQVFASASDPKFFEAYMQYVEQWRAGGLKMSLGDDDIRAPIETFMWAFDWWSSRDGESQLARAAPLLDQYVSRAIARFAELSDAELFAARLDKLPDLQPGDRAAFENGVLVSVNGVPLRNDFLRQRFQQAQAEGKVPGFSNLADYCARGDGLFAAYALRP